MGILNRRGGEDRAAKREERHTAKEARRDERAAAKAAAEAAEAERLRRERHGDLEARKTGMLDLVFAGKFPGSMTVHRYWLDVFDNGDHKIPMKDVQSILLEDGAELQKRLTITRLALIGVFAFAVKKKSGGEKYIVIETTDSIYTVEVPRDKVSDAARAVQEARKTMKAVQTEIAADEAAQRGDENQDPESSSR